MASRYQILDKIGVGGMARVLRAHDQLIDRDIAIKILHSQFADNQEVQQRFTTEIKTSGSLNHPNIVAIYDVGNDFYREIDGADPNDLDAVFKLPYLIMEYVPGIAFDKIIEYSKFPNVRLALQVCYQILLGLQTAHERGIVHRDVKPSNILVREDGRSKLTDFGIARFVEVATAHNTMAGMGTAAYMSPEQIKGEKVLPASDVYSLGCTLFTALTGRTPYKMTNFVQVNKHLTDPIPLLNSFNPQVPVTLQEIINKAMAKNLSDRYQTAQEMAEDLAEQLLLLGSDIPGTSPSSSSISGLSKLPGKSNLPGMSAFPGNSLLPEENAWSGLSHVPELFPPGSKHYKLADKDNKANEIAGKSQHSEPFLPGGDSGTEMPGVGEAVFNPHTSYPGLHETNPNDNGSLHTLDASSEASKTVVVSVDYLDHDPATRAIKGGQTQVPNAKIPVLKNTKRNFETHNIKPATVKESNPKETSKPTILKPETSQKTSFKPLLILGSLSLVLLILAATITYFSLFPSSNDASQAKPSMLADSKPIRSSSTTGFRNQTWPLGTCLNSNSQTQNLDSINCTYLHVYEVAKSTELTGEKLKEIAPDTKDPDTWIVGLNSNYDEWCKEHLPNLPPSLVTVAFDQIWKKENKNDYQGAVRYCLIKNITDKQVNTRSYEKYYAK